jgi:hypothetical protein
VATTGPFLESGNGGKGIRTPDFQLAKLALYQLSYAPFGNSECRMQEGFSFLPAFLIHRPGFLVSRLWTKKMPDGFWAIRHFVSICSKD